jgi:hypothetical protein
VIFYGVVAGDARGRVRLGIGRYAGLVVFRIHVKRPQSVAGWIWNLAMDACALFSLTLIVLRVTGVIAWSWWWVLSPLWISGILVAAALCVLLVLLRWDMSRVMGSTNHRVNRRQDLDD